MKKLRESTKEYLYVIIISNPLKELQVRFCDGSNKFIENIFVLINLKGMTHIEKWVTLSDYTRIAKYLMRTLVISVNGHCFRAD